MLNVRLLVSAGAVFGRFGSRSAKEAHAHAGGSGARLCAHAKFAGVLSIVALVLGCDPTRGRPPGRQVPGGDPGRGRVALANYGCGACHKIPGVDAAVGLAAPPLDYFAERAYIAGILSNNAENLTRWVMDPQAFDERTAMPNVGVTHDDARDIAAYLYTLRR